MGWLRKRRWKKAILIAAMIASTFRSVPASADFVRDTDKISKELKEKEEKFGTGPFSDLNKEIGDKIIRYLNRVSREIVYLLSKGMFSEANILLDSYIELARQVKKIGRWDEIKDDYNKLREMVEAAKEYLEARKDKRTLLKIPKELINIPPGRYVYRGELFSIEVVVRKTLSGIDIQYNRNGTPISEMEWEHASRGKPKELNDYVIKNILTDVEGIGTRSKFRLRYRLER
ncbi:TPA: hypothetical protein HA265_08670 [Candidatus Woesearchaeota archaeon]|nr:hypothetical protein [Candidatus Woesearchaeota archaeon]